MNKLKTIITAFLVTLTLLSPLSSSIYSDYSNADKSDKESKTIFRLFSYATDMHWESFLQEGFMNSLSGDYIFNQFETSLNSLRLRNESLRNRTVTDMLDMYLRISFPDVIIASSNEALEYLKNNYDSKFNGVPVVFCGVDNYSPEIIKGYEKYFTGATETISAAETVDMMLNLYPGTKKIYILNDYSYSGRQWKNDIEKQLESYNEKVEIEYNGNIPMSEELDKISGFSKDTLILTGFYFIDGNSRYYTEKESQRLLVESSKTPVFGLIETQVGSGSLGGKCISAQVQSSEAQKIAERILRGESAENIPVITDTEYMNEWFFDYNELKKWNIDFNTLPDGSVIVNRPQRLIDTHPQLFTTVIFSSSTLVIIIILLIFTNKKHVKHNKKLIELQENLHDANEIIMKDTEIHKRQADLENVLDSLPLAVIILNQNNNDLLYCNDAYIELMGFDGREEALCFTFSDILEDFSAEVPFAKNNGSSEKNSKTVPFNLRFMTKTRYSFDGNVTCYNVKFNDSNVNVIIIQDITSDIKQSELLQHTIELEREANQMKSRFVVNVSHEIRTPMNAIIGLTEIAVLKHFENDAHTLFLKINTSAKHLLNLINDVLDFSKIEADKMDLINESFILEDVLSETLLLAVQRLNKKKVEIILNLNKNVPNMLYGDKTKVWQILKNILDNSAKFTEKGTIRFSIKSEKTSDGRTGVYFMIKDTGIGMSKENLERLFLPFEQFVKTGKNLGTGLGMPITRQLTTLMGGTIDVDSVLGEGSEFNIYIPFENAEDAVFVRDEIKKYPLKGKRILAADSDAFSLEIINNIIRTSGAYVIAVSNANDAMKAVLNSEKSKSHFDMLILNYDLFGAIDIPVGKYKKILLKSDYHPQLMPSEIKKLGFCGVIEKPFTPVNLISNLYNAIFNKQTSAAHDEQEKFKGVSVLLVEDNEINQEVASTMLEMMDVYPDIASDGKEAVEKLGKKHYDLVFMDLIMPVMDGHETTKLIRSSNAPYKNVPIIAMTASVIKEEIEQCLDEGMNSHIGKPISVKTLRNTLRKWLPFKDNEVIIPQINAIENHAVKIDTTEGQTVENKSAGNYTASNYTVKNNTKENYAAESHAGNGIIVSKSNLGNGDKGKRLIALKRLYDTNLAYLPYNDLIINVNETEEKLLGLKKSAEFLGKSALSESITEFIRALNTESGATAYYNRFISEFNTVMEELGRQVS